MVNERLNSKTEKNRCWKKRTTLEKTLLVFFLFLIVMLLILIIYMLTVNGNSQNICSTPGCIKTANEILKRIDTNTDPCDDFYNFACGNYVKTHVMPEYKSSISAFSITEELVSQQIKTLIEQPINKNDIKPFVLIKSYYQACMNLTNINQNSIKNLKKILKSVGGWPVLEGAKWNEHEVNWETTLHKFMTVGINSNVFFRINILPDNKNTSKAVITLNQPYFEYEKLITKGLNETMVQAYYNYMTEVVTTLGANKTEALQDMINVIELNIKIAKILVPMEEERNMSNLHNPMTVDEIQTKFPYIAWIEYFNIFMHSVKKINYNDTIIVVVPNYFEKLKDIFANMSKRTLLNYIYWKGTEPLIHFLNNDLRQKQQNYFKTVKGETKTTPRHIECTETSLRLHIAASALYVKNFFNEDAKKNVNEMIINIQQEFIETIQQIDWMDNTTKSKAIEKAQTMKAHVAYPAELLNNKNVEKFYENLTVSSTNYLESHLNITLFEQKADCGELDKIINKNDWRTHVQAIDVNAYYDPNENSIQFPAGILQEAFFSNDRPKYLNYGAIGYFIGHEISHAFDDEGKQFDKDGNLVNWWEPRTNEAFRLKAQCIIDQYSNYTVREINLNLNGVNTQGENIADNGGIKHAYKAYVKWSKKHEIEANLPGLNYTPQQMFWISTANIECGYERVESMKNKVLSDYHAPNYYRVIVPLLNSEYFAKDFHCQLGSKMNPKKKCSIW